MEFSAEHSKKSLDFAPADEDASSGESGISERASSSSSPFSEKLGDDDHVARFDVKENLRRKLQGKAKKQKSMLADWIRSDEGLTLETSAFEYLYGG